MLTRQRVVVESWRSDYCIVDVAALFLKKIFHLRHVCQNITQEGGLQEPRDDSRQTWFICYQQSPSYSALAAALTSSFTLPNNK